MPCSWPVGVPASSLGWLPLPSPKKTPHAPARGAPPGNGLKKSELAAELHVTTAHLHRVADGLVPLTLLQACAIADLLGLELRC